MLATVVFTILAASVSPAQARAQTQAMEQCVAAFSEQPNDFDRISCLHRLRFEDPLDLIDRLQAKLPHGRYFDLIRGNINWRLDQKQSLRDYRKAAKDLEAQGDDLGAIMARSNAAKLLLWNNGGPDDPWIEINEVEALTAKTKNLKAKRRGIILWSSFAADTDTHIGRAYRWISQIPDSDIDTMTFGEKRDFLQTRARLRAFMLRFAEAAQDYAQLERESSLQGPIADPTRVLAMVDSNTLEYRRFALNPNELEVHRSKYDTKVRRTLEASLAINRPDFAATTLSTLSDILSGAPQSKGEALEAAQQCIKLTKPLERLRRYYARCLINKSWLIESDDTTEAHRLAKEALSILGESGFRETRLQTWRRYMRSAWETLPPAKALELAELGLGEIEDLRSQQRGKAARQMMFTLWTEDYYWLASRLLERSGNREEALAQAFSVLERSRARVLLEYMPEPGAPRTKEEPPDKGGLKQFVDLATLKGQLRDNEAILVYQIANERSLTGEALGGSWVIVVTQDSVRPVRLDLQRFELTTAVSIIRDMAKKGNAAMSIAIQGLREKLLDPGTQGLPEEISDLVIIADGPLHAMPFFSINPDYTYTLAPSATIWSKVRAAGSSEYLTPSGINLVDPKRTPRNPGAVAASESVLRAPNRDDEDSDTDQPLIEGRREAKAMKASLSPSIRSFQGTEATPNSLFTHWKGTDNILHISAHSKVDTENPEDSKILLSNLSNAAEGDLKVSDIYKLPLQQDVVVLAGCSTGWGNWIAGEGILSLARAFQLAGASAVVASLWPIRDNQAADFFEAFYRYLGAGNSITRALSLSQSELRDLGYPPQAYEGYIVVGDGQTRFTPQTRPGLPRWSMVMLPLFAVGLVYLYRRRKRGRSVVPS